MPASMPTVASRRARRQTHQESDAHGASVLYHPLSALAVWLQPEGVMANHTHRASASLKRRVWERVLRPLRGRPAPRVTWHTRGGWLGAHFPAVIPACRLQSTIEGLAAATNQLGAQRLADAYGEHGATRTPDHVRSSARAGNVYAWLAEHRAHATIVEFGAAFGVSGMYFTAGLEAAGRGHLYSFELNPEWAEIAERNIRTISSRVTLTRGAFEDHVGVVPGPIDLAFVDGIHTYDFVWRQYQILRPLMAPGGLLLFDDIDFRQRENRMPEVWNDLCRQPDITAALEVDGRLGIIELHAT